MAPKPLQVRPVQVEMQMTVKGGLLKGNRLVNSCKVAHEGEEVTLVSVSHQDSWLCEMVSGKAASRRPLKRTTMLQQLRRLICSDGPTSSLEGGGAVVVVDKMQDLEFDDSEPETAPTPKKRRRQPGQPADVVPDGVVVKVSVPSNASSLEELRSIRVMKKASSLWIEVDALPWLVHALRIEHDTGGVPSPTLVLPDSPEAAFGIHWDFRDDRWVAKAMDHNEQVVRRSGPVRRRMVKDGDLCKLTFVEAKARVYQEMVAWLAECKAACAQQGGQQK